MCARWYAFSCTSMAPKTPLQQVVFCNMKKRGGLIILLFGALTLMGCATLLNASIPRDGYEVVRNVAYGDDARQRMDFYIPSGLTKPAPVIVFFYGGSWKMGTKDDYRFLGQAFASKGFITAVVDYRLYPDVYFPTFMEDSARAFVAIHRTIAEHGGNPSALFVAGHSAGAYNAMMLAANPAYVRQAGGQPEWIRGVIGIAGPYDFLPLTDPDLIAIFSKRPAMETQPVHFVTRAMPPVFLATGTDDDTVIPRNSERLAAKLQALGHTPTLHYYPDVDHIDIILSLAHRFRDTSPLLEDIYAFYLKQSAP
jgi:acetyl esterase/lipase